MIQQEAGLQKTCVSYLLMQYPHVLFNHPANEGRRSFAYASWLRSLGMKKGMPDIEIFEARRGYHGLFVELKTTGGRLSANQEQMLGQLRQRGYDCAVCRSFEEFQNVINWYFGEGAK